VNIICIRNENTHKARDDDGDVDALTEEAEKKKDLRND